MISKATKSLCITASLLYLGICSANPDDYNMMLRGRLGYINLQEHIKSESAGTPANQKFNNGITGEIGIGYYFTRNFALEFDVGLDYVKFTNNADQSQNLFFIPVQALAQLHLPIHDAVTPYVGAGYVYKFVENNQQSTKVYSTGGALVQAGIDFFPTESFALNFDVKYAISLKDKITDNSHVFKNTFSTLSFTAGVAIPF